MILLSENPPAKKFQGPLFYLGRKPEFLSNSNISPLEVSEINAFEQEHLKKFIINLDSFFKENSSLKLTYTLNLSQYLSPVCDDIIKGWVILQKLQTLKGRSAYIQVDNLKPWKEFFTRNNILITIDGKSRSTFLIKHIFYELYHIFYEFLLLHIQKRKKSKMLLNTYIFIQWINEKNSSSEKIIQDSNYFGSFISEIKRTVEVSLLGLVLRGHKDLKEITKVKLNFIRETLSLSDICSSFCKTFALFKFFRKKRIFFRNVDFSPFIYQSFKQDFWQGYYLNSLLYYKSFKKVLRNAPFNSKIFYPFEHQPWEQALIKAGTELKKSFEFYPYSFFPIPENFLIHNFSKFEKENNLIPKQILVSDRFTEKRFQMQGLETFPLGNARYSHLLHKKQTIKQGTKILCSLSIDPIEAIELTKKTLELASSLNIPFIINCHPLLPESVFVAIENIVCTQKNITLSHKKASDLLNDIFLLLYNSSTVFLDAALSKIPVLYVPCDSIVNLDRFDGEGKKLVDIPNTITFIKNLRHDKGFYKKYAMQVYEKSQEMILPWNPSIIEEILK